MWHLLPGWAGGVGFRVDYVNTCWVIVEEFGDYILEWSLGVDYSGVMFWYMVWVLFGVML